MQFLLHLIKALIDFSSKVNAITPGPTNKLGFIS